MQISSHLSTRVHYQHKALIDIIDGLTDGQIREHIWPGKWSIFEIIVHLQVFQLLTVKRLQEIENGNVPSFEVYRADDDPLFQKNVRLSSREILQNLITVRKDMTASITGSGDLDLGRTGRHPKFGVLNIIEWVEFFLLHEAHHLFIIFHMAAELKKKEYS